MAVVATCLLALVACSRPAAEPATKSEPAEAPRVDVGSGGASEVDAPSVDASAQSGSSGDSPAPKEHFHPFAPGFIDYPPPFDGTPKNTETREGGLTVDDFVIGRGTPVVEGTYVTIHHTGYLDDGYVYDSTIRRHRPVSFFVGGHQALPGWDRGVRGMKVGGKRRLRVPPALAFGDRGRPQVPPGSTLTFTVELLETQGPFPAPLPPPELHALDEASDEPQLRPPSAPSSKAAEVGDRLFVHFERRDPQGRMRETTHRFGTPRVVVVDDSTWTAKLRGLRVGGIWRIRSTEGTTLIELMGFDEGREPERADR